MSKKTGRQGSKTAPRQAGAPKASGSKVPRGKTGGRDWRGTDAKLPKRAPKGRPTRGAPNPPPARERGERHRADARKGRQHPPPTPPARAEKPAGDLVVGRHAVEATLRHTPARGRQLFVQAGLNDAASVVDAAKRAGVAVQERERDWLDHRCGALVHQGFVLEARPYAYADLDAVEGQLVLVLDGVQDPRNLGAAARAALAMGACALIIPDRRAARVTATAEKTAAGAFARLPVVLAANLRRALEALKARDYWVVGAEADAQLAPHQVPMDGQIALVVGGEDRGLRRLTRELCDHVVAIPMTHPDLSLNAADAAALLLYEAQRQRLSAP